MQYHVGDFVICRVSYDEEIIFDVDFNDPRYISLNTSSFEVIALTNLHYILLVPVNIEGNFNLTEERIQKMGIDSKHKDKWATFVKEEAVGGRVIFDYYSMSLPCIVCKEYFPYVQPNQDDGRFACWSCKNDERYKLIYKIK